MTKEQEITAWLKEHAKEIHEFAVEMRTKGYPSTKYALGVIVDADGGASAFAMDLRNVRQVSSDAHAWCEARRADLNEDNRILLVQWFDASLYWSMYTVTHLDRRVTS